MNARQAITTAPLGTGPEMRESSFTSLFVAAYRVRILRPLIRYVLKRLEGGIMFSRTWRKILARYEKVSLGDFSYGPGVQPGVFDPGTRIGRFSSFAAGVRVLRRNHPPGRFSQHPLFFNPRCGLVAEESIPQNPLTIGNDVWVGMNVIICPGCFEIGDGAIIGAGSVVTRDVPPYTIVGGSPARPIRRRFSPEVESVVASSRWWSRPWSEIRQHLDLFTAEVTEESLRRFAAAFPASSRVEAAVSQK